MKIIKLHQSGRVILVNLNNATEIYTYVNNESEVFFNFAVNDEQVSIVVDESLDEIYEKIKGDFNG